MSTTSPIAALTPSRSLCARRRARRLPIFRGNVPRDQRLRDQGIHGGRPQDRLDDDAWRSAIAWCVETELAALLALHACSVRQEACHGKFVAGAHSPRGSPRFTFAEWVRDPLN